MMLLWVVQTRLEKIIAMLRMSLLLAGIPQSVPSETVNRLCASGMSAVVHAHRPFRLEKADYLLPGCWRNDAGPWVISKLPQLLDVMQKCMILRSDGGLLIPAMEMQYGCDSMGGTAENLAQHYHISREDQDQFAFWSQQKFAQASLNGIFRHEIIPVQINVGKMKQKVLSMMNLQNRQQTNWGTSKT